MQCLSEELVARKLSGKLTPPEQAAVAAHLGQCAECSKLVSMLEPALEEEATIAVGGPPKPLETEGSAEAPTRGTILGRYMVLEEIGSGGLGQVFSAFDPELDRKVAIKLLKPAARSPEGNSVLQVRLLREAQAMAKLSHPNVVTVYDVGTLDDQVFIAMELIDGLTLRQWVRKEPRTWKQVRDVLVKAGQGLIAAHDAGLIHRDFKPGNVLVSDDGRVRVLDFGIARGMGGRTESEIDEEPDSDIMFESLDSSVDGADPETQASLIMESITRTGTFMGTPGYMPPEQYDARKALDGRADQFAFCVTLHEALYRKRPFKGRDVKTLRAAAFKKQVISPPPGRKVPGWMRKVILRGLEPRPERRFENMKALLHALQRDKRTRKRQWIAVAATAIISAGGAWGVAAFREPPPDELAMVKKLSNEARAAAAQSYYVYPPSNDKDTPTAYSKVLELEAVEGAVEDEADERALQLRQEFASTLVRLGDHYWDREGGKPFAIDYYASALVFDRDNERARERATLTPGELASLRDKATKKGFTDAELEAAESLIALAETDEDKQVEKLAVVYKKTRTGNRTQNNLDRLLGDRKGEVARAAGLEEPNDGLKDVVFDDSEPEPEPEPEPELVLEEPVEEPEPAAAPSTPSPPRTTRKARTRDPRRAQKEAKDGQAAFRAGRLGEAEAAYHRALNHDNHNYLALYGLAELAFERGRYTQATQFGRRARRVSPRKANLRILLGDAYYKLQRYTEAREEYEEAKKLGSGAASGRLARVERKLNG